MNLDIKALISNPIAYMLVVAIGVIGYFYDDSKKRYEVTVTDLKNQLEQCAEDKEDSRDEYMDLFKECNE